MSHKHHHHKQHHRIRNFDSCGHFEYWTGHGWKKWDIFLPTKKNSSQFPWQIANTITHRLDYYKHKHGRSKKVIAVALFDAAKRWGFHCTSNKNDSRVFWTYGGGTVAEFLVLNYRWRRDPEHYAAHLKKSSAALRFVVDTSGRYSRLWSFPKMPVIKEFKSEDL